MEKHRLEIPRNAGKGLTEWFAVCSCGATWRCWYSRHGLEWTPQNDKCASCPAGPAGQRADKGKR